MLIWSRIFRLLIIINTVLMIVPVLFAGNRIAVPLDTFEEQSAMASGDINELQQCILQSLQPRGIWLVTGTQVYNYNTSTGWNQFENHQHLYHDLWSWLQDEEIIQQNNSSNWINYQHYLTEYINDSQAGSYTIQNWQSNQWQNYYRSLYQYNTSAVLSDVTGQMWQNNVWQNYSQSTYYLGTGNSIQYIISQIWQNSAWVNSMKTVYSYNAGSQISEMTFYTWQNNAWLLSSRMIYTYNTYGEYSTILTQTWNSTSSFYQDANRATYSYVFVYNYVCDQILYENWQNNAWQNQMRMLYTCDSPGNVIESIRQYYSGTWLNNERRTMDYYFLDVANNDENIVAIPLTVTIAPNPTVNTAFVRIKSTKAVNGRIELYNLKGQSLITKEIQISCADANVYSFDISALPAGIYFVKTSAHGQQIINRMLKIK